MLIYFDELKNAFECDEIYKQQEKIIELHGNRDWLTFIKNTFNTKIN